MKAWLLQTKLKGITGSISAYSLYFGEISHFTQIPNIYRSIKIQREFLIPVKVSQVKKIAQPVELFKVEGFNGEIRNTYTIPGKV